MYKVITTKIGWDEVEIPWGVFTWLNGHEEKTEVIKDLDGFIKQITKEWPKLEVVEFDVHSPLCSMHPKKFNKWFRDGILKEYHKKKGYKINWIRKNIYSIDLK